MWFAAVTSTSAYLWLFALLRLGCGQDFPNSSTPGLSIRPFDGPSCSAPPQPENGQWRLHPYFCNKRSADCNVPEGTPLGLGYQLIYNCTPGYRMEDYADRVYCDPLGKWSKIPLCEDVRCYNDLNPGMKISNCTRFGKNVKCEEPVLPHTEVKLSCQDGWTAVFRSQPEKDLFRYCDPYGWWSFFPPECRMRCEPVNKVSTNQYKWRCGVPPFRGTSHGWVAKSSDFPWHATLYKEKKWRDGRIKMFICGATIIQANFVMTAAHCVYDERFRTMEDAGKLYVMAGNEYRDYDHPPRRHESYVQRTAVKKVDLPFDYYGLRGNYGSDIALLELQTPFTWSRMVSPANWDASSPDAPILQNGAIGKVAGFGRTETLDSSPILQASTSPYVPYSECRPPSETADNYVFIMKDKFCAGYTNGTAVCDGDSGGGLVFATKKNRYVMGIVSVSLGVDLSNGERTCSKHALTVYTKVSEYTDWIRKVTSPSVGKAASVSTVASFGSVSCVSPVQPTNGKWKFNLTQCTDLDAPTNCSVAPGFKLKVGTTLVYSCNGGYEASGSTDVLCHHSGTWSNLPECVPSSPSTRRRTLVAPDGAQEKISELPWQASVYLEKSTPKGIEKQFQCVATMIKANLLLTTRNCVHNENTNTTLDPEKLFVMAGNIHPNYDSPLHDPKVVRKSGVESLHVNCTHVRRDANFSGENIALLQLKHPLQFTNNHSQPLPKLESYNQALRDLDDSRNVFIFRTTRVSSCLSPEKPANGDYHSKQCIDSDGSTNCRVAEGVELEAGTGLVYSCYPRYKLRGHPEVYCSNLRGSWSSIPDCVLSDSLINYKEAPVGLDRAQEKMSKLPWQASVYLEKSTPKGIEKQFRCVATVIKANLLLTTRNCVYNENTNTTLDPKKLFVIAGNIHPDYDSPLHDPKAVRKNGVEVLHRKCVHGKDNVRFVETALLQLKHPLQFSLPPPFSRVEDYSRAFRDLDDRRNIFIFRTARGPVVCDNGITPFSLSIDSDVPWPHLNIDSPSDYV